MALALPALRTVRVAQGQPPVLPQTALQSVVSSSGLACQCMGLGHREESQLSKVGIGPALMVGQRVSRARSLLLLAPQCA